MLQEKNKATSTMTGKITDKNKNVGKKCGKIAKWYIHFGKQPIFPKK